LGTPIRKFEKAFTDTVVAMAKKNFTDIVPTTYEESKAYLDEELSKPEGQRDPLREMCMVILMQLPDDEDVLLKNDALEHLIQLPKGKSGETLTSRSNDLWKENANI
jgi:hypothetical protein